VGVSVSNLEPFRQLTLAETLETTPAHANPDFPPK
jgi:hypothetical protein